MKTILLLDDDPDEQLLLSDAFAILRIPVELIQFLTFPELTRYLAQATVLPDMLLLDINMPGMNGVEILRLLKSGERYSNLRIVMHSNTSDSKTIDECFQAGVIAFLKKTADMKTMLYHLCILMTWNTQTIFSLPPTKLLS